MANHISSRSSRESKTIRNRKRLVFAASIATLACTFQLQATAADTTATWSSETSDNWTSTSLWSTAPNFPINGTPAGTNYQAMINATGGTAYTVTLNSNVSVNGLTLNSADATVDQTAGALSPGSMDITAGTYELDGGTITGGTINTTGGAFINASTGTLDGTSTGGITLVGTLKQDSGATTSLQGLISDPDGFTFDAIPAAFPAGFIASNYTIALSADTELTGDSTTTLANTVSASFIMVDLAGNGTSRLTIDKNHTLLSQTFVQVSSALALTNNGFIQAQGGNTPFVNGKSFNLVLNSAASSNTGTIEGTGGGYIWLSNENGGFFTNTGTIEAEGKSTVILSNINDSTFANMATVQALSGSELELSNDLSGANFMNSGKVIVDGAGSILLILGGGFTNTESGTIQVTNGATVEFEQANFTNKGTFSVHNGIFDVGILDIGAGTLTGSGTINGNLTLDSDPSTLAFNISGETQGADYDSLTINGTTILAGDLQLTLTNGFFPLPTDIFTVLNVDSSDILTGSFLNVANGGRLETTDGGGSFEVLYGSGDFANEIVLEDFQPSPVPEPSSIVLAAASLTLLTRRKRRI